MPFKPVDTHLPAFNPFEKFGSEWALLTAGDSRGVNTMTVSWGCLGVLWNRDGATVYVLHQGVHRPHGALHPLLLRTRAQGGARRARARERAR